MNRFTSVLYRFTSVLWPDDVKALQADPFFRACTGLRLACMFPNVPKEGNVLRRRTLKSLCLCPEPARSPTVTTLSAHLGALSTGRCRRSQLRWSRPELGLNGPKRAPDLHHLVEEGVILRIDGEQRVDLAADAPGQLCGVRSKGGVQHLQSQPRVGLSAVSAQLLAER